MSVFRSPLYLDEEIMVPLANYHDIEVMTDIAVSQRDRGERAGRAALRVRAPLPGSPSAELGGSRSNETELTQERTVRAHPTDALNRLLDALHQKEELSSNLAEGVVTRHQVVEVDGDWDVSPATDVGNLLTSVVAAFVANPAAAQASEPPAELMASLMGTQAPSGTVVLEAAVEEDQGPRLLVLLNADYLLRHFTLDDLTEERTVFGQVDSFVPEGSQFSLQKFFLSGFGRSIRRAISVDDMLQGSEVLLGRPMTADDFVVEGPAIVIRAIAIY